MAAALSIALRADNAPQVPPLSQAWSDAALITTNDVWSGVPGIQGFLGQDITSATGVDPQTLVGTSALANDLDVIANQTNPNITNGGVAEFEGIANPTVALQGSGTADAPHIVVYLNTVGRSGITVSYVLRDVDASADNAVQPVALQYRVGAAGDFINLPAGFVADATTGPSLATLTTPVSVTLPGAADNQPEVQVRIITTNAAGSDEWVGIDDLSVTSGGGSTTPSLSLSDASVTEGASGVTTARFTVTLSAPALTGGVTFDIATADDSATAASGDYSALALVAQTIAAGASQFTFDVDVLGDSTVEPNETFFVNVTNVTGASVADGQGTGTILNDDVALTSIAAIQGTGASSPLVGASVVTRGIVTGRRSNAFFVQEPDASVDADPLTSEGILVFTASAPPATAAVGNVVQVSGRVTEFVPSADPGQAPLTELAGTVTVSVLTTGQALPTPVTLTTMDAGPTSALDSLERYEGMRVAVPSLTVTGPTLGSIAEASASATSSGVFYGVLTGVPRPFREPGFQQPDALPAGAPTTVTRFDANPERLRVDSDSQPGAAAVDVSTGAVVTGLVGPLDYSFRTYTILPDPATPPAVTGGAAVRAARAAGATEVTVSGFNLERFFDTVDDPGISDVALSAAAFDARLGKASTSIRDLLRTPDILGVVEMENLATLQALATRISADAAAAGQTDPQYAPFLVEGNDIGGIDVGFLLKTAPIALGVPRVTVNAVVQEGLTATYTNPNTGLPELLNDRPPLVLDATVNFADGRVFPVTVIANHLRSLNDVANAAPQGAGTVGARVRAKRAAQAEFLAQLVQMRQVANPSQRIVLVGDFNAFEFSDGLVDVIGTIKGTPAPATAVVRATTDLVEPNLANLMEALSAAERYSYVFDGNAQVLDHVLVNGPALANVSDLVMVRGNADQPETARNAAGGVRLSDHDAPVAYFRVLPVDVTADVRFTRLPLVFNPFTKVSLGLLLITNRGANTMNGPLHVVFDQLTGGVSLLDADGSIGGSPYETLSVGSLAPGHTTALLVRFANPNRASIAYVPRLWRGVF
jgi:predicted extracellular nuclease